MTPEEKSLLEQTYALAQENNKMLQSIRRTNRLALLARILYWAVILGFSFGAYYFIQPYLSSLMSLYDPSGGVPSGSQTQSAADQLRDLFK